ncbi:hypothetical protein ACIQSO_09650 [Pseudomonas putida]|uniref:hypothetical protein n=1 Tax=Pseudomonas putida TaxID=303 RepID=UPI00383B029E
MVTGQLHGIGTIVGFADDLKVFLLQHGFDRGADEEMIVNYECFWHGEPTNSEKRLVTQEGYTFPLPTTPDTQSEEFTAPGRTKKFPTHEERSLRRLLEDWRRLYPSVV